MKYIYIYTTESFKARDWYKVGETTRTTVKRIAEQDGSASPEPLLILHTWVVDNTVSDKSIHSVLEDSGFNRLRKGREWFELSNDPIADITVAIKDLGRVILESTEEITYTNINANNEVFIEEASSIDSYEESLVEYSIPTVNELWWALGISPEQSIPKQLELL